MNKKEMINEIVSLCKVSKENLDCSIFWLADTIKEIVEGKSYLGDLQDEEKKWHINKLNHLKWVKKE